MTRSSTKELANYDSEIEKTLRLRRKEQTSSPQSITCEEMENEELNNNQLPPHQVEEQLDEVAPRHDRILRDYARPDHFEGESSVRRSPIAANNFEIRIGLIQTIQQSCQFAGVASEAPHTHLIDFLELVETCRYNGVTTDAIRLWLFPFSLKGEAKTWLRSLPRAGVNQVEAWNSLAQQIATLTQKVEAFQVNNQSSSQLENCDVCGGNHPNHECQASTQNEEQVNMIGYRNNYSFGSPMTQKHPGFQWSNPNGAENPQRFFNQKQQATDEKVESQHSAIKNLEIQVSQLATLMSGQIKGSLPSNTEKNPKEHFKAISLQSGKTLDDPYADRQGNPQEVEQVNESKNKRDSELLKEQKDKGKRVQENELMTNPYSVPLPFPQKLKREKLDKQFSKFLEILKQLYINIPFTYALKQMPAYAKFLKEILSSKRKLEEVSVIMLTEKCSVILQNKLPQKKHNFEKALCDSGASINLMPFSIFRKLELGEMRDTGVSLQLADQST
uniref:Retrotransposon gag domain-containing protein n=1 Tax=Nicotiana tabacum TaxID=4097 RepID=A0A1S4DIR8_TOBAC|nr:PREDICTED: uncharacterized protein LOC107830210 [Nicotiana tabacum]